MWLFPITFAVVLANLFVALDAVAPYDAMISKSSVPTPQPEIKNGVPANTSIIVNFVGDIMLGRNVESRIQKYDEYYPFKNISELLQSPDVAVANFEGIVQPVHIHTPDFGFQFSIREEYLSVLKNVGIDILSLANNHSFDYGAGALAYTREQCKKINLICIGSPNAVDSFSTTVIEHNTKKLGLLFLHAVNNNPDMESIQSALVSLQKESDIQIAYIHWGEEYSLTHSIIQEQLAHTLIDLGIDVIIGHHPHVIQDVELYKQKPIFYSLGNFIFDQYFSQDVQEGLSIKMELFDTYVIYTLIPVTSINTHSQPQFMEETDSRRIYDRILKNVDNYEGVDAEAGLITIINDDSNENLHVF